MELAILDQIILERKQALTALAAEIRLLASTPVRDVPSAHNLFDALQQKAREQSNHQIALDALCGARERIVATKGASLPALAVVA